MDKVMIDSEYYYKLLKKEDILDSLTIWLIEKAKTRCDDCFCMNEILDKINELEENK